MTISRTRDQRRHHRQNDTIRSQGSGGATQALRRAVRQVNPATRSPPAARVRSRALRARPSSRDSPVPHRTRRRQSRPGTDRWHPGGSRRSRAGARPLRPPALGAGGPSRSQRTAGGGTRPRPPPASRCRAPALPHALTTGIGGAGRRTHSRPASECRTGRCRPLAVISTRQRRPFSVSYWTLPPALRRPLPALIAAVRRPPSRRGAARKERPCLALDRAEPPAGSHPDAGDTEDQATATASARRHRIAMTAPSARPTRSSASRRAVSSRTAPRPARRGRRGVGPRTARSHSNPAGCQPGQAGDTGRDDLAAPASRRAITKSQSGWAASTRNAGRRPSGRARRTAPAAAVGTAEAPIAPIISPKAGSARQPQRRGRPGGVAAQDRVRGAGQVVGGQRRAGARGPAAPTGRQAGEVVGPTGVQLATDPLRDRLDMARTSASVATRLRKRRHRQASRSTTGRNGRARSANSSAVT